VRPAPAPAALLSRSQRRKRRKRAKRDQPVGPATPAPVRAKRPAAGARAGPSGPAATPARTVSGSVRTPAVSRGAPPGAAKSSPAVATPSGTPAGETGKWEVVSSKRAKRKKAGKEGGGNPPPSRAAKAATLKSRPAATPAKVAPPARAAGGRLTAAKPVVNKAARSEGAGAAVPPDRPPRQSKKRRRKQLRRRLPRTAAVGLTIVPGGGARTSDPCDILRRARAEVPDIRSRYGIKELRSRRTTTGDILLEIPGADASRRADELAALLRKHAEDVPGVKVVRPVRRVELRISGLEPTVTTEEVARAVSDFAPGCDAEDIRVGTIREARSRGGSVWVQAPAIAGVPAAEAGKIKIGWVGATVVLLKGRPLRCFRCLAPGHAQRRCPCLEDRSRCCFNCGREDHTAAVCRAKPFCPSCKERGRKGDEEMDYQPIGEGWGIAGAP